MSDSSWLAPFDPFSSGVGIMEDAASYKCCKCHVRELHWLPVKFRVEFKIALLVFKTMSGLASQYLSELLVVKPRTRYRLLSDYETLLVIPNLTQKT